MDALNAQVQKEIDRVYINKAKKEQSAIPVLKGNLGLRKKKNLTSQDVTAVAQPPDSARTAGLNDDIENVMFEDFSETLEVADQAMPPATDFNDLDSVPDSVPDSSLPDTQDRTAKDTNFDYFEECIAANSDDDISVREEQDETSSEEAEIRSDNDDDDDFAEDDLEVEADQAMPDELSEIEDKHVDVEHSMSKVTATTKAFAEDSSFDLQDESSSDEGHAANESPDEEAIMKHHNTEPAVSDIDDFSLRSEQSDDDSDDNQDAVPV